MADRCAIKNNYGFVCNDPALYGVYWTQTGEDEITSCAQHLSKALRQLKASFNGGHERTFRVRFLK